MGTKGLFSILNHDKCLSVLSSTTPRDRLLIPHSPPYPSKHCCKGLTMLTAKFKKKSAKKAQNKKQNKR